jgi:IPT/TIG domain
MPAPTPPIGYTPTFHMPIIGPPPRGISPFSHYAAATTASGISVLPGPHLGLIITLSNASFNPLFAMVGGLISFIPAGDELPTLPATERFRSPGSGSLMIQTWIGDVQTLRRNLPPGVPPPTRVLYLNVQPASVRAALHHLVQAMTIPVLQGAWNRPSPASDRTALEGNYLDLLLLGQAKVFVPGGALIGNAEHITPGNPSSNIRTTLLFVDGAGNDLSPILHLRSMPSFAAHWADHPLINATATIAVPVNIHLQFEVWNETSHVYEPLRAGVAVDLRDYDAVTSNDLLGTQNTDAQGRVNFSIPNIQELDEPEPDLFFLVHTNGRSHAGHTLPRQWSTKGWKATDGSPGYYENFRGTQLGDETSPLVFRIGVDFHAKITYQFQDNTDRSNDRIAPIGIPVSVWVGTFTEVLKRQLHTDPHGEVHGVIFDVNANDSIYYSIEFELTDATIHLPRARVEMRFPPEGWKTFSNDADRKYYPDNDRTTLGSFTQPDVFRCTAYERNVALYFLTILREISTFLFHMTGGAWTGVDGLEVFRTSISGTAYSWPLGEVNLPARDHWNRRTIVHELSHQIMWKEVGISNTDIALEFGPRGELHAFHRPHMISNEEHALIEGWAEFFAGIFEEDSESPPYTLRVIIESLKIRDRIPPIEQVHDDGLGPPPPNLGEEIEGAFANGLWAIFKNHVVTSVVSSSARVPQSANGDVISTAPWLSNAAVRDRFISMIWGPLSQLRGLSNPKTSDMHLRILNLNRNPAERHNLMAELQRFNEAMAAPTVSSISPSTGGAQRVTITGTNFVARLDDVIKTTVTIAGATAAVSVNNSTTLTVDIPPGPAGRATLVITTPAGSVRDTYTYV